MLSSSISPLFVVLKIIIFLPIIIGKLIIDSLLLVGCHTNYARFDKKICTLFKQVN